MLRITMSSKICKSTSAATFNPMDALILTNGQATGLRNIGKHTGREIQPRLLDDGTWILNADVLDDPAYMNGPWGAILRAIARPAAGAKTLQQFHAEEQARLDAK